MKSPDTEIALTLSRVTKLLLHRKIIKDDESLTKAISAVAQKSFSPVPNTKLKPISPLRSLQRIISHSDSNKKKLEQIREKIRETQKQPIQEKPKKVQKMSKKVEFEKGKIGNRNVFDRIQGDLLRRREQLKLNEQARIRKENEEFIRNCSFSPFNNRRKITRTPDQVVRDLYRWKEGRDKVLGIKQEWFREEDLKNFKEKPEINRKSEGLSKKRGKTPIVERLAQTQRFQMDEGFLECLNRVNNKKWANTCRIFSRVSLDTEKSAKSTQNSSENKNYADLIRSLTDRWA